MPSRRVSTRREIVRGTAISIGIGLGIALLMFVAAPGFFGPRIFLHGALVGLFVYAACLLLQEALAEGIAKLSPRLQKVALGLVYFAGGNLGWFAATLIARELALVHPRVFSIGATFILINGLVAVVIGFLFYGFEVLRQRLAASAEKLKASELAEKELQLARSIQSRLLPSERLAGEGYRLAARNLPARYVAGDFYDVFRLGGASVGLAVADVSGKGIGASLVMASVKAVLPLLASGKSVEQTLQALNEKLHGELAAREFVALAYARYDPEAGEIEIANAGLPDPYRLRAGGAPEPLSVPGPRLPLGVKRGVPYRSLRVALAPGDRVLVLTDGLPEAPTPSGDPLGYESLVALLPSDREEPGASLEGLLERVRRATSPNLEDDWTVLLLEHAGDASGQADGARAAP
jgi:hypothetical protein